MFDCGNFKDMQELSICIAYRTGNDKFISTHIARLCELISKENNYHAQYNYFMEIKIKFLMPC